MQERLVYGLELVRNFHVWVLAVVRAVRSHASASSMANIFGCDTHHLFTSHRVSSYRHHFSIFDVVTLLSLLILLHQFRSIFRSTDRFLYPKVMKGREVNFL
jgi:hypothetical protein